MTASNNNQPIPINSCHTQSATLPLAVEEKRDTHSHPTAGQQREPSQVKEVKVFRPRDPPKFHRLNAVPSPRYLGFDVPDWVAREWVRQGKAIKIDEGQKRRGIQIVQQVAEKREHTIQAQLQGWKGSGAVQPELPDLNTKGLARIDQVEGLPVVGDAIKMFYIGKPKAA